ncbi:MAG: hypothetical protein ABI652_07510, partial [Acidobacteriota bacterium]
GPGTAVWVIVLMSLMQGLVSSVQFTSMNSLVYADISDADASKASSIASTAQQLALSFGVAFGSVAAQWFLHDIPQTDHPALIQALHHAFAVLGLLTVLSSLTFSWLRAGDGSNVSRHLEKRIQAVRESEAAGLGG